MNQRVLDLACTLSGLPHRELYQRLRAEIETLTVPERFELLHRLCIYHHPESLSGAASTLAETAALRAALPALVARHGIATMLDLPCGDFHWMQRVDLDLDYIGADVVVGLVAANEQRHGGPRRRFVRLDALCDPLPTVDLIHCRDLLIHLSLEDCRRVIDNFVASGSRWLLTNHFEARYTNPDITSGDFRAINLCAPPFAFPPPREVIDEASQLGDGAYRDRAMALWSLADLAACT